MSSPKPPYWSFHVSAARAVENAARAVHEGGAVVMKCEGNHVGKSD